MDAPMGDKIRRRLVRFGDRFTELELQRGEAELEIVEPAPEPAQEPDEPWGRIADLPKSHSAWAWLRERLGHHGDD